MSRLELRPLADEHLDAAAELLAERHRRHRAAEPTLPARFEDAAAAREEIEAAWRREGASGAAGFLDGRLAGYLLGAPDDEAHWGGPNVWIGHAGHAAAEPELGRDLHGLAAERWVDEGRPRPRARRPPRRRLRRRAGGAGGRPPARVHRPRAARAGRLPRLGGDAPGGARLRHGRRADRGGLRLGPPSRLRDDGHRLAGDEPALVAPLAAPRPPHDLPPPPPPHARVA